MDKLWDKLCEMNISEFFFNLGTKKITRTKMTEVVSLNNFGALSTFAAAWSTQNPDYWSIIERL